MRLITFLILLSTLITLIAPESDITEDNKTFVPTNDWKEIKKGLLVSSYIFILNKSLNFQGNQSHRDCTCE